MHEPQPAYGLRVSGLDLEGSGREAPESWPEWSLSQIVGPADDRPGLDVWPAEARIGLPGIGEMWLDRQERSITLRANAHWSGEALLHPVLAPAAAVIAHWMRRSSLHAAAVVVDGGAWGLLAERGGGKSTTAALFADRGCGLLTDDLLVAEGETCFAGPAAVDLRAEAAAQLGGRPLGRLGNRERWRKPLPVGALEAPLSGWIELRWSDGPAAVACADVSDRLQILSHHAGLPLSGENLLALADRPMLRFTRPHSVAHWSAPLDQLLERMS